MRCIITKCKNDATVGFTTCLGHRRREKTVARVGDAVIIDTKRTGWQHGFGNHGRIGTLLAYECKPSDETKSTVTSGHVYGLVEHADDKTKCWYQWEWIVKVKDFEKLSVVKR